MTTVHTATATQGPVEKTSGYAPINGLNMYYDIQGSGKPLVFLGLGFSVAGAIQFPTLARKRQVISPDLQGRGRTADIDRPLHIVQMAEDVVALLDYLEIEQADIFAECIGGSIAMLIALRHPERVRRVATYGSIFGPFLDSYRPEIIEGFMGITPDSNSLQYQREEYKKVAPDPEYWPIILNKFISEPVNGFSSEELRSIRVPTLIAVGDQDWPRLDKVVETFQTIPGAELAIIPDAGHFVISVDQQKVMPTIETFLDEPLTRLPFATTKDGYHPGINR